MLLLEYIGERVVDLIPHSVYESKKIKDDWGEHYAIFDEGDDWYVYSVDFVKKNFKEVTEFK